MNRFYNLDDIYEKKDDVALFDYTAKPLKTELKKPGCSNVNCFEGIMNQGNTSECMSYRQCLQYFNTLPLVNCIDNVPVPSFISEDIA